MTIIMSSNNGSTWDLHEDIPRPGIVLTRPVLPVQTTEVVITRRDRLSLCEVRVLGGKSAVRGNQVQEQSRRHWI